MPVIDEGWRRWIRERTGSGVGFDEVVGELVGRGFAIEDAQATVVHVLFEQPAAGSLPEPLPEGPVTSLETHDRTIAVLAAMESPRIVVFGGVMSPDECTALIELSQASLSRSTVVEPASGSSVAHEHRTSSGMHHAATTDPLLAKLDRRLAELVKWPAERCEAFQVMRYGQGEEYRPHWDYFEPDEPGSEILLRQGGNRVGTIVVYLTSPAEGGATIFPDVGLEVLPVRGNAVFFRYPLPTPESRTLHGGRPVLRGEKWIATKWLRQRAIPTA
jgi:prolyl 4-hydroxylase